METYSLLVVRGKRFRQKFSTEMVYYTKNEMGFYVSYVSSLSKAKTF